MINKVWVMCQMVTIVDNTVLHNTKLLRIELKCSYQQRGG